MFTPLANQLELLLDEARKLGELTADLPRKRRRADSRTVEDREERLGVKCQNSASTCAALLNEMGRLTAQVEELEEQRSDDREGALGLRQEVGKLEAEVQSLREQQAADKQTIRDLFELQQRSQRQELGVTSGPHRSSSSDEPAECKGDDELRSEYNRTARRVTKRKPTTIPLIPTVPTAHRTKGAPMTEKCQPGMQKGEGRGQNKGEDNMYDQTSEPENNAGRPQKSTSFKDSCAGYNMIVPYTPQPDPETTTAFNGPTRRSGPFLGAHGNNISPERVVPSESDSGSKFDSSSEFAGEAITESDSELESLSHVQVPAQQNEVASGGSISYVSEEVTPDMPESASNCGASNTLSVPQPPVKTSDPSQLANQPHLPWTWQEGHVVDLYICTQISKWWYKTPAEVAGMDPKTRKVWSHIGRIMETELGAKSQQRYQHCEANDEECWIYTVEGAKQISRSGMACARCRVGARPDGCSLVTYKSRIPPVHRPPFTEWIPWQGSQTQTNNSDVQASQFSIARAGWDG